MTNRQEQKSTIWARFLLKTKKLLNKVSDVVYPPHIKCIVCGDDLPQVSRLEICEQCNHIVEYIDYTHCCQKCGSALIGQGQYCFNCKNDVRVFEQGKSVFVYKDDITRLIAGLKYKNKKYLGKAFASFLVEKYKEAGWSVDCVIPVPLSPARAKWRGYNQSELLAKEFCKQLDLPLRTDILYKIMDTESQASLNLQERKKNLLSSFEVPDKSSVKGKSVLVIDDVMTTGATLNACATALIKAKASKIYVLTIAHGKINIPVQDNFDEIDIKKVVKY